MQRVSEKPVTETLIEWLPDQKYFDDIICIRHPIVRGMEHTHHEIINDNLLKELYKISSYDPDHLPAEIKMIRFFKK